MSDDRLKSISQNGAPQNNGGLKRRDLLLSSSTLLAAWALSMSGLVKSGTGSEPSASSAWRKRPTEHPPHNDG
jgi:hypothetical protein